MEYSVERAPWGEREIVRRNGTLVFEGEVWEAHAVAFALTSLVNRHGLARIIGERQPWAADEDLFVESYDGPLPPDDGEQSTGDEDQDPAPFTAPLGKALSHEEAARILEQHFPEVAEGG